MIDMDVSLLDDEFRLILKKAEILVGKLRDKSMSNDNHSGECADLIEEMVEKLYFEIGRADSLDADSMGW